MSLDADVVPALAETLTVEMDAHRPAGVFISYASKTTILHRRCIKPFKVWAKRYMIA